MRCFESHGSGDAVDFTGAQRQQQVPALKVSSPNQIDDAQTSGDGPANVDAKQISFGNAARFSLSKFMSSQTNPQEPKNQRQQRPFGLLGQFESGGLEYDAKHFQPFFDMTARQ